MCFPSWEIRNLDFMSSLHEVQTVARKGKVSHVCPSAFIIIETAEESLIKVGVASVYCRLSGLILVCINPI
jgi:hypothetical protein